MTGVAVVKLLVIVVLDLSVDATPLTQKVHAGIAGVDI
jgi:hypothetical protein